MAKKWSQAYSNGYKAGKAGKRFPKAKWNRYSQGFKKGYARGKQGGRSSYGGYRKTYRRRTNYRKRRYY